MDTRLSLAAEQRLRNSLISTLETHIEQLGQAFHEGLNEDIRKIGHSLKGNSGAHYFNLNKIKEIGFRLEKGSYTDDEFYSLLEELRDILIHLKSNCSSDQDTW
jgi:HPt (histidine-containing phosphotransfer) domain-containing protein